MKSSNAPIVIGHRGASGYLPEHTLASYELAVDMGADFIEPDLVSTKDGVLVARHENALAIVAPFVEATTDVQSRPEFAGRLATKVIDGASLTGWFVEDFTLAELKTLRARERLPQLRSTAADGRYDIPTLQEVIDLAQRKSAETGRSIGIYPETKHPTYFDTIGLSLEEPLVSALRANRWDGRRAPVYVQSFEVSNLRELRRMVDVPIVQLIERSGRPFDFVARGDPRTYADLITAEGLRFVAEYADGIGPNKDLIAPRDSHQRLGPPTTLIQDAHAANLIVHGWTFRDENAFLPLDFRRGDPADAQHPSQKGDAGAEYRLFYSLEIDGVFSDQPDTAVLARAFARNT